MDIHRILSYEGRATRKEYWLGQLIAFLVGVVFGAGIEYNNIILSAIGFISLLLVFVPIILLNIRRWHDLNMSGWMTLINFIPYIGNIITLIWQGFIGPVNPNGSNFNNYGVDPRINIE